ncbi:MAG TPA: hypothetical protein VMR23_06600 [Candidatus Limnocylindria bacterium]|nr:hypothetical protein [Candidatus Limnocylindria bacterium]
MSSIDKSPLETDIRFLETMPRCKSGNVFHRDRARFEQGEDSRVVLSSAHAQRDDGQMGRTDHAKRDSVEIGRFCLLQSLAGGRATGVVTLTRAAAPSMLS